MKAYLNSWYLYEDGLAHVTRDEPIMEDDEEESICGIKNRWVYQTDWSAPRCPECVLLNTMLELAQ